MHLTNVIELYTFNCYILMVCKLYLNNVDFSKGKIEWYIEENVVLQVRGPDFISPGISWHPNVLLHPSVPQLSIHQTERKMLRLCGGGLGCTERDLKQIS